MGDFLRVLYSIGPPYVCQLEYCATDFRKFPWFINKNTYRGRLYDVRLIN